MELAPVWRDRRSQEDLELQKDAVTTRRASGRHRCARLRPAIAQRFGDVQPSHGVRSVEVRESASYLQRAMPRASPCAYIGRSYARGLVAEKLQGSEDSRLTYDQHHHPFEEVDLVGFHLRQ